MIEFHDILLLFSNVKSAYRGNIGWMVGSGVGWGVSGK